MTGVKASLLSLSRKGNDGDNVETGGVEESKDEEASSDRSCEEFEVGEKM
jgi:hypothetical protein